MASIVSLPYASHYKQPTSPVPRASSPLNPIMMCNTEPNDDQLLTFDKPTHGNAYHTGALRPTLKRPVPISHTPTAVAVGHEVRHTHPLPQQHDALLLIAAKLDAEKKLTTALTLGLSKTQSELDQANKEVARLNAAIDVLGGVLVHTNAMPPPRTTESLHTNLAMADASNADYEKKIQSLKDRLYEVEEESRMTKANLETSNKSLARFDLLSDLLSIHFKGDVKRMKITLESALTHDKATYDTQLKIAGVEPGSIVCIGFNWDGYHTFGMVMHDPDPFFPVYLHVRYLFNSDEFKRALYPKAKRSWAECFATVPLCLVNQRFEMVTPENYKKLVNKVLQTTNLTHLSTGEQVHPSDFEKFRAFMHRCISDELDGHKYFKHLEEAPSVFISKLTAQNLSASASVGRQARRPSAIRVHCLDGASPPLSSGRSSTRSPTGRASFPLDADSGESSSPLVRLVCAGVNSDTHSGSSAGPSTIAPHIGAAVLLNMANTPPSQNTVLESEL